MNLVLVCYDPDAEDPDLPGEVNAIIGPFDDEDSAILYGEKTGSGHFAVMNLTSPLY